jgi:hypothetical protein
MGGFQITVRRRRRCFPRNEGSLRSINRRLDPVQQFRSSNYAWSCMGRAHKPEADDREPGIQLLDSGFACASFRRPGMTKFRCPLRLIDFMKATS